MFKLMFSGSNTDSHFFNGNASINRFLTRKHSTFIDQAADATFV